MDKNYSSVTKLDIWEDVLKKNVKSNLLKKAVTVPEKEVPYDVQIFELLVAESLNMQDRHTNWEVTKASHDSGIDLIGKDTFPCKTPFATTQYRLLSVGQVKRRKGSYKYDDFRTDLRKARGYWVNSDLFAQNSPKQFLFILSTDSPNGIKALQEHLDKDLTHNKDVQLKNDQLTHVQLIDAAYIIKSWKFNLSYFEELLKDALSPEQLACFHEYVLALDCSWISVSVQAPNAGGVKEPLSFSIFIELPTDDISLSLYARWIPPKSGNIQLLHPLRMVDPRSLGSFVRVKGKAELQIILRSLEDRLNDFGKIELYSEEKGLIASASLGQLEIYDGFCPIYYDVPNKNILEGLKKYILFKTPLFSAVSVTGCGGIGKSSLLTEVMISAVQQGYFPCDIGHPKDLIHPRYLLCRLIMQLIRPNIPQHMFLSDVPFRLKSYLGNSYNNDWNSDIEKFYNDSEQEVCIESIAYCIVLLLIDAAETSPVFLWLSNMHWASKETLEILRIVVEELYNNQELFKNNIFCIFEGRSGEVLTYDQQFYYPADWLRFLSSSFLRRFELAMWSKEDSLHFLQQLFVESGNNGALYNQYFERLVDYTSGIPMQMMELIREHLEQQILQVDPICQYRLRIKHFFIEDTAYASSIADIIERRIHFYRKECSDFIDFCIILAVLDDAIPLILSERLMKILHTNQTGIDRLVFQSGFLVSSAQEYHFYHEHYQAVFQKQQLKNDILLEECLQYFKRISEKDIRDKYSEIKLQLLRNEADLVELRYSIIYLLRQNMPKSTEQSLYKLLLHLPPLPDRQDDIPQYQVLFELCESCLREGSWQAGQHYLEQLLDMPRTSDFEEVLVHIKAYQELSNILGDRMHFDFAIRKAEDGLELAELCLDTYKNKISKYQYRELYVQKEKLLARLAVCHWFSGSPSRALSIQRECYELASRRKDTYSSGHVLYEIGTLMLHFDAEIGIAIMENVLRQCNKIPSLEEHERTLIETQLLMGKLLLAARSKNNKELRSIALQCLKLLEADRITPHSYERFLCLTIRGICFFLLEQDTRKALDCFFDSLQCAVESEMPNLKWKALLHIAQLRAMENNEDFKIYADEAQSLLQSTIEKNHYTHTNLCSMFAPALNRLTQLPENKETVSVTDTQTMISVSARGCLFVIMN